MSITLRDILADIQGSIENYLAMPKRKRHRRKYWDAYIDCVRLEMMLQDAIRREGQGKPATSRL